MFRVKALNDVATGETCVIDITAKRAAFTPRIVQVIDSIDDLTFIANVKYVRQ